MAIIKSNLRLEYFEQLLKKAHNETILIFDDIHWSAQMEEAWEIIKQHNSVTLLNNIIRLRLVLTFFLLELFF